MTSIQNAENGSAGGGGTAAGRALLKVVDFTRYMPGPVAGRLLRDIGAEVIKVENPKTGDATRGFAPYIHGEGLFHVSLNAGIRSLALASRAPEWPEVIAALARWADVFLVGGLPDGLKKLGIDFDSLRKLNPRIVHCNVTGYGETGPLRALPAHGLNPDAYAGIVPLEWHDGLPFPQAMFQSVGAPLAGVFAAFGVLAALRRRDASGEPQRLDVSLYGAAIWFNWRHVGTYANLGKPWFSYGDFGGRYATYETSDGKIILVCPIEKVFWERFCGELGLPEDWKTRGTWGRSEMDHGMDYPWERAEIARRIREKPRAHWEDAFVKLQIPFACVMSLEETLASEQTRAIGALREVSVHGHRATIPALPVHFQGGDVCFFELGRTWLALYPRPLLAADAPVAQHDAEPVLRQLAPQRHAHPEQKAMIPDRLDRRRKSSDRHRNVGIAPRLIRNGFHLHVISRTASFDQEAGCLAQIGRPELDRLRHGLAPGEPLRIGALEAGKTRHVLDIERQMAGHGGAEIDQQQRKEGRRPLSLQPVVQGHVSGMAAQPVDEVVG